MKYLIGIGTFMAWDDSIGLRIAEHIAETGKDDGFKTIVLAGTLIDLVDYVREADMLLLVDSAHMGAKAGEYRFFNPGEVNSMKDGGLGDSHSSDLMAVLDIAQSVGVSLEGVTIMGIEPERVDAGDGLSDALSRRFDEYEKEAVAFMES